MHVKEYSCAFILVFFIVTFQFSVIDTTIFSRYFLWIKMQHKLLILYIFLLDLQLHTFLCRKACQIWSIGLSNVKLFCHCQRLINKKVKQIIIDESLLCLWCNVEAELQYNMLVSSRSDYENLGNQGVVFQDLLSVTCRKRDQAVYFSLACFVMKRRFLRKYFVKIRFVSLFQIIELNKVNSPTSCKKVIVPQWKV